MFFAILEFSNGEKNEISDLVRFLRIRYIQEEYLRDLLLRQRTRSLEPITKPDVFSTQHRQDLRIPKQNEDFSRQGMNLPSYAREFSQKPMEISKSSPTSKLSEEFTYFKSSNSMKSAQECMKLQRTRKRWSRETEFLARTGVSRKLEKKETCFQGISFFHTHS